MEIIKFPRKQTPAAIMSEGIKKLSSDYTILAIWINPKTSCFEWATQAGEANLAQMLGSLEIIKQELIREATESMN